MRAGIPVALLMALVCSSCATKQYAPFPDQSKTVENPAFGRIYVVRPSGFGCAVPMHVSDGEKKIGRTGGTGYLCWEREPGSTVIRSTAENSATVPLDVERGEVYYLLQSVHMGVIRARTRLDLVDDTEGEKLVGKCPKPKVVLEK